MNVLIIKHIDIEGPGLIEYCLKQEKSLIKFSILKPALRFPNLDNFTHIVISEGP